MTDIASRNYKIAFFFALAVVVALAAWLVLDWRNAHQKTAPSAEAMNTDSCTCAFTRRECNRHSTHACPA